MDIIHNKNKLKLDELRGVEVPKHRQTTFIKFTAALRHSFKQGSIQVSEKPTIAAKSSLEGLDQIFLKLGYKQSLRYAHGHLEER